MKNRAFFSITPALSRSFWAYHITGWLILMMVHILLRAVVPSPSVWTIWTLYLLLENSIGFSLMILVRTLYRRVKYQELNYGILIIVMAVISFVTSLVWQSVYIVIAYFLSGQQNLIYYLQIRWIVLDGVTYHFPIVIGWSFLYFGIKFWFDWQNQREAAEKAVIAAHQAQLQLLRYKLKPHFLFNSLLTIREILEEDKRAAKKLLTELSEFLRYSLLSGHNSIVRFQDEVEATKIYLNIEQFRNKKSIYIDYEIDPDTTNLPVSSFVIQPIVERIVDGCTRTNSLPLSIIIKSMISECDLIISVSATYKLSENATPSSVLHCITFEMDHLIERMKNAFGDRYVFNFQENNGIVNVMIRIQNIFDPELTGTMTFKTLSPVSNSARR